MTSDQFQKLSLDLKDLSEIIPVNWGFVQNNQLDCKIDMFKINDYQTLEIALKNLNLSVQNYFRRRWFLWKCAQCDEFLFYQNPLVLRNPNPKSQQYDIEFFANPDLQFDVKGTVVPKKYRRLKFVNNRFVYQSIIEFFYAQQSTGVRKNYQNRLFVMHHSFASDVRELFVRTQWDYKNIVFLDYVNYLKTNPKLFSYDTVKADIILIYEDENKTLHHKFGSQLI